MRNTEKTYRIGEIAEQTGVTAEALRYYERLGLLQKLVRTDGGARRYAEHTVGRVRLIKQVQALGLTLREVIEVLGDSARRSPARWRNVHRVRRGWGTPPQPNRHRTRFRGFFCGEAASRNSRRIDSGVHTQGVGDDL